MLLDKGMKLKQIHDTLDPNSLKLTQYDRPGGSDLLRLRELFLREKINWTDLGGAQHVGAGTCGRIC